MSNTIDLVDTADWDPWHSIDTQSIHTDDPFRACQKATFTLTQNSKPFKLGDLLTPPPYFNPIIPILYLWLKLVHVLVSRWLITV